MTCDMLLNWDRVGSDFRIDNNMTRVLISWR